MKLFFEQPQKKYYRSEKCYWRRRNIRLLKKQNFNKSVKKIQTSKNRIIIFFVMKIYCLKK